MIFMGKFCAHKILMQDEMIYDWGYNLCSVSGESRNYDVSRLVL